MRSGFAGVAVVVGVLAAGSSAKAQNFVTHDSAGAPVPAAGQERPEMVFPAPAYTPNADDSYGVPTPIVPPRAIEYLTPQPIAPGQHYAPAALPNPVIPSDRAEEAAPVYTAPAYTTPAPQAVPAQNYTAPQIQQPPAPNYQPVTVAPSPAQPVAPAADLKFQQESETSRVLLALEDVYLKQIKALETEHQARKAKLLDQFEKDAADPDKVVGLAERLRSAMAGLDEQHKQALAAEETRYTNARLKVLAASPTRLQ